MIMVNLTIPILILVVAAYIGYYCIYVKKFGWRYVPEVPIQDNALPYKWEYKFVAWDWVYIGIGTTILSIVIGAVVVI